MHDSSKDARVQTVLGRVVFQSRSTMLRPAQASAQLASIVLSFLAFCYDPAECAVQVDNSPSCAKVTTAPKGVANTGSFAPIAGGPQVPSNSSEKQSAEKGTSHLVILSWSASKPATESPRAAIIGYIVYRSTKPHDDKAKPINVNRVAGTSFVDSNVEPGKTYYYVTRAVSANGALSGPSNEVRAEVPSSPRSAN
jgi:hypothetical protein